MKQREQFRPIAPVYLEEEAKQWLCCDQSSPHMHYTYKEKTNALVAVVHVNMNARI